jgi:hypothetical protein
MILPGTSVFTFKLKNYTEIRFKRLSPILYFLPLSAEFLLELEKPQETLVYPAAH